MDAYKCDMKYRHIAILAMGLLTLSTPKTATSAEFDGEVLIAPPPPNWSGGASQPTKSGIRRVWKRDFQIDGGSIEEIAVTRMDKSGNAIANLAAQQLSKTMSENCSQPTVSEIKTDKATIGSTASFTILCSAIKDAPPEIATFAMVMVYVGDFNTYAVVRTWRGNSADPTSPANSPRTGEQWAKFFDRISVCNTLTDNCSLARAEIIHADPRFKVMRALPTSIKPVMVLKDMLAAAKGFGTLTGRAEQCGEDVSPLTSKIARMFEYVAANDQDSSKALTAFKTAKIEGLKDQEKLAKETCGEVLRDYRQHPTRVSAFPRYIERFL